MADQEVRSYVLDPLSARHFRKLLKRKHMIFTTSRVKLWDRKFKVCGNSSQQLMLSAWVLRHQIQHEGWAK